MIIPSGLIRRTAVILLLAALPGCNRSPSEPGGSDADDSAPPAGVGLDVRTLEANAFQRDYRLYTPESANLNRPVTVVMVLHGEPRIDMGVISGMASHANARGFVAAYPNAAFDGDWVHACDCTANGFRGVNDVEYFQALLADLEIAFPAGVDRVFVAGFAEGALMAWKLACSIPERFNGFAMVSASMWTDAVSTCLGHQPTPMVIFNGNVDPRFPWEGTSVPVAFGPDQNIVGVVDNVGFWAGQNGCPQGPIVESLPDQHDDGTSVDRWSWEDCSAPAVFYEIIGGGHPWPGMPIPLDATLGRNSLEIDASDVMIEFFLGPAS